MAKFICNPGSPGERLFELGEAPVLIGRTPSCDVYVPHKSLSRQHARLERRQGAVVLVDLESKNGTFVNGVRIEQCEVHPGDAIRLGEVALAFWEERARAEVLETPSPLPPSPLGGAPEQALFRPMLVRDLRDSSVAELLRQALSAGPDQASRRVQQRLKALLEASQLLASPRDVNALLGEILERVFRALGVERAAILLVEPGAGTLEPRIVRSASPDIPATYSQQIVDYVHAHGVSAIFSDALADPRLSASGSILLQSIRASMCVPLRTQEAAIGVLYVDSLSAPDLFGAEDLEFLAAFAHQAAMAIENARLYRRIEEETVSRMQLVMDGKLASLNALVAGIAHELKNPLNIISSFASLSLELADEIDEGLRAQRPPPAPQPLAVAEDALGVLRGNLGRMVEHGKWAASIIDKMLRHARGGSGQRELMDLNALLHEALRLAATRLERGEVPVQVELACDAALEPFEALRSDLVRVFINVIENACDAMQRKRRERGPGFTPRLSIRTAARADMAEVRIRDNGHGIPAEVADKIYTPFFTTKPPGEGTGLGLSLSYEIIVQGHQGRLQMDSQPGEYTEFIISLPLRPPPAGRPG